MNFSALFDFCVFCTPVELTEAALLRDLIFVFQNIDGEYITFNKTEDAFRLSNKVGLQEYTSGNYIVTVCLLKTLWDI